MIHSGLSLLCEPDFTLKLDSPEWKNPGYIIIITLLDRAEDENEHSPSERSER